MMTLEYAQVRVVLPGVVEVVGRRGNEGGGEGPLNRRKRVREGGGEGMFAGGGAWEVG